MVTLSSLSGEPLNYILRQWHWAYFDFSDSSYSSNCMIGRRSLADVAYIHVCYHSREWHHKTKLWHLFLLWFPFPFLGKITLILYQDFTVRTLRMYRLWLSIALFVALYLGFSDQNCLALSVQNLALQKLWDSVRSCQKLWSSRALPSLMSFLDEKQVCPKTKKSYVNAMCAQPTVTCVMPSDHTRDLSWNEWKTVVIIIVPLSQERKPKYSHQWAELGDTCCTPPPFTLWWQGRCQHIENKHNTQSSNHRICGWYSQGYFLWKKC